MVHYLELSKHAHFPPETHDFWEFHYVDKGSAISISDGERIVLNHGDILFLSPMSEHQLITDGSAAPNVCVVSFSVKPKELSFLEKKKLHLNAEERSVIKKFLTEAGTAFDLSRADPSARALVEREDAPEGVYQMMKIHLEELLILLARGHTVPKLHTARLSISDTYSDKLVQEMIVYMQDNLTENLTIADFTRRFRYGKTHLCNRFSAATGKSINRYFTELKVNAAKQIIREQSQSRELFSRIAELLGFSSPSYFYATFKKITNMTPSEYFKSVHQYDFDTEKADR